MRLQSNFAGATLFCRLLHSIEPLSESSHDVNILSSLQLTILALFYGDKVMHQLTSAKVVRRSTGDLFVQIVVYHHTYIVKSAVKRTFTEVFKVPNSDEKKYLGSYPIDSFFFTLQILDTLDECRKWVVQTLVN